MADTPTRIPTKSSQTSYSDAKDDEGDLKGAEEGAVNDRLPPLAYDKVPWYAHRFYTDFIPHINRSSPVPTGIYESHSR